MIEALRLFARIRVGEPAKYKVERWDWKDSHVEEIVASASLIMIGQAAVRAAVEPYPRRTRLTFCQGARVSPEIALVMAIRGSVAKPHQPSPEAGRPRWALKPTGGPPAAKCVAALPRYPLDAWWPLADARDSDTIKEMGGERLGRWWRRHTAEV